ncbi:8996_t:CDS:2 [Paraglomus brasilianum]|uniref:8996_t:CDS:1 n=1 Tax=Paraglomus brasilianum TaxID=144538 RepID=A0A9N9CUE3_9GLOM|nr:8996_t:CDS:2 [Paraglomus brasilianum]
MHGPRLEDLLPMHKDLTIFKSLRGYVTIFAPTNLAFFNYKLAIKNLEEDQIQLVDDTMRRLRFQ